jgi:outer membrane protein OmpA-like peptidoglycan-associated protein
MYGLLFVMSLLAVLPACKKQKKSDPKQTTQVKKDKNKRRGSHDVEGYAFEDAQNFNLSGNDMENFAHSKKESLEQGFSWQDADIEKDVDGLEPVYFDFDKYNIKNDSVTEELLYSAGILTCLYSRAISIWSDIANNKL